MVSLNMESACSPSTKHPSRGMRIGLGGGADGGIVVADAETGDVASRERSGQVFSFMYIDLQQQLELCRTFSRSSFSSLFPLSCSLLVAPDGFVAAGVVTAPHVHGRGALTVLLVGKGVPKAGRARQTQLAAQQLSLLELVEEAPGGIFPHRSGEVGRHLVRPH